MREIIFRAKDYRTGQWVYGIYFKNPVSRFNEGAYYPQIIPEIHGVHDTIERCSIVEDTLGQFTGLTDKNGVKIFEGDIVTYPVGIREFKGKVIFWCATFCVEHFYPKKMITTLDDCAADCDIIGNIFDNPELLGGVDK